MVVHCLCFRLWRITQVWLKGTVLKTVRWAQVHARVRISYPPFEFYIIAGWSSLVARRAHNPKVVGSNPAPAILVPWSSWLGRLPVTQEITSSSLVGTVYGSVAQSVEQWIEAPCVGSSILSRAINTMFCGCSLVVKPQPSKLLSRVRFSSPAPWAHSSAG